jgi:hypothetical protein
MPCFPRQPKAPTCAGCGPRCTTGSSATADANGPPSSTAHSNPSARTAPTSLRDAVSGRSSFANVTTPAKTGSLVGPTSSTTSWTTCNEPTKICLLTRSPTQRRIFGRYQRARWLERSGALGQNFATQAVGERSTAMARPPANMRVRRMALHGPEISAYLAPSTSAMTRQRPLAAPGSGDRLHPRRPLDVPPAVDLTPRDRRSNGTTTPVVIGVVADGDLGVSNVDALDRPHSRR